MFNVGDRVKVARIKDSTHFLDLYDGATRMYSIPGKVGTVISPDKNNVWYVNVGDDSWYIHADDLVKENAMVEMPNSFKTMVRTDDTKEAMQDLMELKEFREMLVNQWDDNTKFDTLGNVFWDAVNYDLNIAGRQDLFNYICDKMGWEDPAIVEKKAEIARLKERIAELEKEIAQD